MSGTTVRQSPYSDTPDLVFANVSTPYKFLIITIDQLNICMYLSHTHSVIVSVKVQKAHT